MAAILKILFGLGWMVFKINSSEAKSF